jgi:hypothetical protein
MRFARTMENVHVMASTATDASAAADAAPLVERGAHSRQPLKEISMSFRKATPSTRKMHQRYAVLLRQEKAADARCRVLEALRKRAEKAGVVDPALERRFHTAENLWESVVDARNDVGIACFEAPITSPLRDMLIKLKIVAGWARTGFDINADVESLARQLAIFAKRHAAA